MEELKKLLVKESFRLARKIVRDAMASEHIPLTDESELIVVTRIADGIRHAALTLGQILSPALPADYWTKSEPSVN